MVNKDNATLNRENLLELTSNTIKLLNNKINSGRFRDKEIEKLRLSYQRLLGEFIKIHNSILKDSELEELKERIKKLEEAIK